MSTTTAQAPAIPPRPPRSQEKTSAPMVPPRPSKQRAQRSISPNPDRFAPSPLNETTFLKSPRSLQPAARNGDPIPRSTSVELPSVGEEGKEYAGLAEELSSPGGASASPEHTRTVAEDLKLHAPKPSLPAASAKQRVMAVTRTDSERAASFGIGRSSSVEDSTPALPSNRSLKKKASTASQLSTTESYIDDEQGIPEIGQQVPMYPNAGDVQAPSPSPATVEGPKGRHHARKTSARGNLPPGSYGLHGHGVVSQDKLDKAYYEKHPDLLKKEHVPHHYDRPNDFSMSSEDLNKIVRDTITHGSGIAVKGYVGTPSDQVGWQALEESTSRVASPGPTPEAKDPAKPGSAVSDSDKESRRRSGMGDVIHVEEPNHRRSVMFSDSESVNADDEVERPYTAPILADDEVAKDPSPRVIYPAVEPPFEVEEPSSRPTSRPASLYKETSFELRPTPLEDVEEYEPLFQDDEKQEAKKPAKEDKAKPNHKRRFPSADIWEDAPSSVYYTAEVSTPEFFDEQEKPSPAAVSPPREGETPAQAFARHQEELAEKEARAHGPEGLIPARHKQKPVWAQHQQHLAAEAGKARPPAQQRFPSRDVWEDTPDSLKLETTVSTPQQDEVSSPADAIKPEIPERPQKSPAPAEKPAIPERPRLRQTSGDDKPAIPERPKPQIPPRPAKTGPTSGGQEPAETAAPPPRQKPAVPARPMGSKIAALQAGFMNDLNRRLQLGPQAPPKREEASAEDEQVEEKKEKEKVPLSDARKGRARGPQRRAPTSAAAAATTVAESKTAEEKPRAQMSFGFVSTVSVFEIDPDEGILSVGGVSREETKKGEVEGGARVEEKKSVEVETEAKAEAEAEAEAEVAAVERSEKEKDKLKDKSGEMEVDVERGEAVQTKEEPARHTEPEPEPEKEKKEGGEEETKSLATNMAGETLIEEQVKTDGKRLTVEPIKVEER
ncbi:Altered inheritance of mitochondria protein 21 [Madurella fahalii]|uniref:Altered inheritance of mitochondria protein 21 n=1 Tax=Madurella fahalii TaxID=1157608 RepID=A0ABQ0GDV9_9PEZI